MSREFSRILQIERFNIVMYDRCALDTMRFVDLLLTLLFEGHKALPKGAVLSTPRTPTLRRMDSSGERSHRHLIDCIRSKDTEALIEAVENGSKLIIHL